MASFINTLRFVHTDSNVQWDALMILLPQQYFYYSLIQEPFPLLEVKRVNWV